MGGQIGWSLVAVTVSLGALTGCGSGGDSGDDASTGAASNLAPSQASASTVAEPASPPPCDPRLLTWSTAEPVEPDTVLVVRAVNTGDVECEIDVSESEIADSTMEPDVWLQPGATAELLLVDAEPGCGDDGVDVSVPLTVNARPVEVAIDVAGLEPWCQLSAVAIYSI